jgi:hypothetical protein
MTTTDRPPERTDRTWHDGLRTLGAVLRDEAVSRPGKWAWRRLARGAVVSCRVHPEHQAFQFRIARETKPALRYRRQWAAELSIFERHLGLQGWTRTEAETETGGIAAFYLDRVLVLGADGIPGEGSA